MVSRTSQFAGTGWADAFHIGLSGFLARRAAATGLCPVDAGRTKNGTPLPALFRRIFRHEPDERLALLMLTGRVNS